MVCVGAVFRENGLPGRSTSRYVSIGVDTDRFLSKEAVEVHSLFDPTSLGTNEMFFHTFLTIYIFLFYAEQTLFLCPIFLFGNICLSAFLCQRFWKLVFFSAGIYFYWMKLGHNRESKVSSPLAYTDCPEGGTCVFCVPELPWASVNQQGDFLRTLQRGWWVSTHPSRSYIMLPYLPDSPMIPTELSAITQTFHTWTVHHSGSLVLKMEMSSLKPETPLSSLHPFCV